MTISKWWMGLVGVVLLVFVVVGALSWLQEHDARLKAETQSAAAQKTVDQAKADAQTVQQTLAARVADLEKQRQQPVTAPQVVLDMSKVIPNLPQPATVVQPPPTTQTVNGKTEEVPSAPVVQIPQTDFTALQNYRVTCDETTARLQACTLTAADSDLAMKAMTADRDNWKAVAKGGTWWHRALTAGKWVLVGAGAGYAAGHKW
jgi:cytoskeletal protein RodZ